MIEFTISRVVLCACGMILILSVAGVLNGVYDRNEEQLNNDLADRFAYMLDVFQSSDDDTLVLDGIRILPEGCTAHIHDGFVELLDNDRRHMATTEFKGEFLLKWGDIVTVTHRTSRLSS